MEQMMSVCRNPWCKAHFYYTDKDMVVIEDKLSGKISDEKVPPMECPKCKSFDKELSGGVTWTEKKYEGSRIDGSSGPISINVSRYIDTKKW
jgi:hypothetical protein